MTGFFQFIFSLRRYLSPRGFRSWWSSAGGGREVVWLALPMIISSGSMAFMQFADRVFLTWYDPQAMGAAFSAGQFFWLLVSFPFSVTAYAGAFVSQYNGAKRYDKIGAIVWQGLFFGLALTPLLFAMSPLFERLFLAFNHQPETVAMERTYLWHLFWGFGAVIGNESLSAFFSGRKRMLTVMIVNIMAVMTNILLDYLMIFGVGPFEELGLAGAAIATSISQWLRLAIFLVLMFGTDFARRGRYGVLRGCRPAPKLFGRLFYYGGMGGLQLLLEAGSLAVFVLLLGMISETATASTAIAFNLNGLSFLPVHGTGVAVITLVGNYLGEERPFLARRATLSALAFGTFFTGIFMLLYLCFPNQLLSVYAWNDPEAFKPLRKMTTVLLRFVAVYLFFDTLNIIFCSAIKGAGDTRFVMILSLVTALLLVLPAWLGVRYGGLGVYWCWSVMTGSIFFSGVLYAIRFFDGKWMKMRLFEPKKEGTIES